MVIETPLPEDAPQIERVAEGTGVFNTAELRVVRQMLGAYFHPGPEDDYEFVVYRNGKPDSIAGFACFGPAPLTDCVWDLYWICVDRSQQCAGIGSQLLQNVEDDLSARGARAIYLETSDSEAYCTAREFYQRHGYEQVAHLDNFYAPGEGKVVYRKALRRWNNGA